MNAEVTIYPLRDTFRTGDTINVSFRLPREVENNGTGTILKLTNVDITTRAAIEIIDQVTESTDIVSALFNDVDLITYPDTTGDVQLVRLGPSSGYVQGIPEPNSQGDYTYAFAFVPKSLGLYRFAYGAVNFGEELGLRDNILEIEQECDNSNIFKLLYLKLVDGNDDNLDMLCQSTVSTFCVLDEPRRSDLYEDYRRQATFIFRVLE
ncbi:hypothetical protein QWY85_07575 [Neolewinella lacunae]|uniref:Uncharacterized protein n=1 Tax=Neolewinella lacunae TaxID=1517758 RepID=A0A923PNS2_9BACT|nr:hypothetical protein [Neolewinella lacunae]MBC6994638.1 hypothetical protein [Neolewinella lacunae]MDN3634510.1 hypothetical protein [Neolewinella lacunae]